jgi:hypothetical protein
VDVKDSSKPTASGIFLQLLSSPSFSLTSDSMTVSSTVRSNEEKIFDRITLTISYKIAVNFSSSTFATYSSFSTMSCESPSSIAMPSGETSSNITDQWPNGVDVDSKDFGAIERTLPLFVSVNVSTDVCRGWQLLPKIWMIPVPCSVVGYLVDA